jgi:hypothetical protein
LVPPWFFREISRILPDGQIKCAIFSMSVFFAGLNHQKRLQRKIRIVEAIQRDLGCPDITRKYSDFQKLQINLYLCPSRPTEGRFAIVTDVGTGCDGCR